MRELWRVQGEYKKASFSVTSTTTLLAPWPFKEELVKEFAWKRAQILADEKRKKDEKKARRMVRSEAFDEWHGHGLSLPQTALAGDAMVDEGEEGQLQMAALQAQAAAKGSDFETRKRARLTEEFQSTDKDNSRKAYFKEFRKVVELADVVIQTLYHHFDNFCAAHGSSCT
eukprot:1152880-Pelagomonas_calceolata.AAC.6